MAVRIQEADFDVSAELAALRAGRLGVGGLASFLGTVRDLNQGDAVSAMELEHYPGMTERALEDIVAQAHARWTLLDALVIHRVGKLAPGDQIVLVIVAAAHRGEAFAACEFIMDYLKTAAPFWKKESTPAGARWVDARDSDDRAMEKWGLAGQGLGRAEEQRAEPARTTEDERR
ncbi:MAG: molybdopterin synthase catalytic subunit MoaE [Candidatus Protistobacter heckmanni]|nr:molybdopterin synthase catalytic subunit MoaE [Candidatus Protistobacter heckmanni]